jgi:hypothetical protein
VTGKRVSKSEHFRDKSRELNELRKQILEMYEFISWKEFIHLNNRTYSRYSRDQLLYAKKHLKHVEDESILEMAIVYCLENKTYSMNQLKDTYEYQLNEHKKEQGIIHNLFQRLPEKLSYSFPDVAKRSVNEYESIVRPPSGGTQ